MKQFDNKQEVIAQEVTEHVSDTPEKGYVINKGLPSFVGPTEFKRLNKVIDEKNELIANYKNIQELVDRLESENSELKKENVKLQANVEKLRKKQEPLFAPELRELMESSSINASEYEKFMNLYAYWLQHRNDVLFYKSRLKQGRSSVKDLKKDLQSIKAILTSAGNMGLLDRLSERIFSMTAHLDTLQQRLSAGVDEVSESMES